jgi:IS5 family transposase
VPGFQSKRVISAGKTAYTQGNGAALRVLQQHKLEGDIMEKAARHRSLTSRQKQRNRLISATRGIVERTFGALKQVYGIGRARYIGRVKRELVWL